MSNKVLLAGNIAIAEGAILAGCQAYFGYPITPQNELLEHMAKRMPGEGRVFVQTESELAAINMVYGAAAAGCRPNALPVAGRHLHTRQRHQDGHAIESL